MEQLRRAPNTVADAGGPRIFATEGRFAWFLLHSNELTMPHLTELKRGLGAAGDGRNGEETRRPEHGARAGNGYEVAAH